MTGYSVSLMGSDFSKAKLNDRILAGSGYALLPGLQLAPGT